jgi:glutamine synthetase
VGADRGERRVMGIGTLPVSLDQALDDMAQSDLVAEALGEEVFSFFLRDKSRIVEDYRRQVTQWELDQLIESI